MALYDIADIINKTLFPVKTVDVYDSPDGNIIGTVSPPNAAGVVYSWVYGRDGSIWWMFEDNNSNLQNMYGSYYIKHDPSAFNVSSLTEQGVITTAQKIAQQKEANMTTYQKIEQIVKWVGIGIAGVIITKAIIMKIPVDEIFKRKRR